MNGERSLDRSERRRHRRDEDGREKESEVQSPEDEKGANMQTGTDVDVSRTKEVASREGKDKEELSLRDDDLGDVADAGPPPTRCARTAGASSSRSSL